MPSSGCFRGTQLHHHGYEKSTPHHFATFISCSFSRCYILLYLQKTRRYYSATSVLFPVSAVPSVMTPHWWASENTCSQWQSNSRLRDDTWPEYCGTEDLCSSVFLCRTPPSTCCSSIMFWTRPGWWRRVHPWKQKLLVFTFTQEELLGSLMLFWNVSPQLT